MSIQINILGKKDWDNLMSSFWKICCWKSNPQRNIDIVWNIWFKFRHYKFYISCQEETEIWLVCKFQWLYPCVHFSVYYYFSVTVHTRDMQPLIIFWLRFSNSLFCNWHNQSNKRHGGICEKKEKVSLKFWVLKIFIKK